MNTDYAMNVKTGSKLLTKVSKTSSDYFNRNMHDKMSDTRRMEAKYALKDPKLLKADSEYPTLGPFGLCGFIQEEYSALYSEEEWPALATSIPSGNLTPIDEGLVESELNRNGRKCFDCDSRYHLRGNKACPKYRPPGSTPKEERGDNNKSRFSTSEGFKPKAAWKYIAPADPNQTVVANGSTWKWCSECICPVGKNKGYYNLSHTTKDHRNFTPGSAPPDVNPSVTPVINSSATPAANLAETPASNLTEIPTILEEEELDEDDPDNLTFTAVWLTTIDIEAGGHGNDFHSDVITVENEITSDIVQSRFPSTDIEISPDGENTFDTQEVDRISTLAKDANSEETGSNKDTSQSVPHYLPCFDEFFDCTEDSLPLYDLSMDSIYFDSHEGSSLDMNMSQDQDSYDTNDNKDDVIIDPFPCSTNTTFHQVYYDILSFLFLTFTFTQILGFVVDMSPTWGYYATLLTSTCNLYHSDKETVYTYSLCYLSIFWDTLLLFFDPPNDHCITRQVHRKIYQYKKGRILRQRMFLSLALIPASWMVLSGSIMTNNSKLVLHPVHCILNDIAKTYHRSQEMATLVDLSPSVLFQYNSIRLKECQSLRSYKVVPSYDNHKCLSDYHECKDIDISNEINISEYYDCVDTLDILPILDEDTLHGTTEGRQFLFDSVETHSILDQFYDCQTDTHSTCSKSSNLNLFEWLDPRQLVSPEHHVDCTFDTKMWDSSMKNCISPTSYNASLTGSTSFLNRIGPLSLFQVIFDSGASKAISGYKEDFIGEIITPDTEMRLGGMANGMLIEGVGIVKWRFETESEPLVITTHCYYVPSAKVRLISPQRLFNRSKGLKGEFICREDNAILTFEGLPQLEIEYDSRSNLPIATCRNQAIISPQLNLCVSTESNQNITPAARLLLQWHYRYGHKCCSFIQHLFLSAPFASQKYLAAAKCFPIPKCDICEFAKAHRTPTKGTISKINPKSDGALKDKHLRAGSGVSVDHYESRLKGRSYTSFGKATSEQYVGGCIFVDHMSSYIHVEHQLGFSSSETIRAKQNYEQLALESGVVVENYLADNGIFKAKAFVQHLRDHNQKVNYCGVNAHHKNAVAERSIRTVSEMARAMMLHSSIRWKHGIDSSLWPMAIDYSTYIYNHTPNRQGIAPADLFTGSTVPRHKLKDIHVFGCPVYVLHPTLQQGKKLPRWQPRSRRGVFVGFSPKHSSDVPLVLNLQTGSISPQYHVVFDDTFSTVISIDEDENPPSFWNDIDLDSHIHRIPLDEDENAELRNDWLTPPELEEKSRRELRSKKIRASFNPSTTAQIPPNNTDISMTLSNEIPSASDSSNIPINPESTDTPSVNSQPSPTPIVPDTQPPNIRRSMRSNKGQYNETRYINEVFLSSVTDPGLSSQHSTLAYHTELSTDLDTSILNCSDPRAYAAKVRRGNDIDNPSFHEAIHGNHAIDYQKAMELEIKQLMRQKTWQRISRSDVPLDDKGNKRRVLKGTWAFKLKRFPDGTPHKFKARYCVRGDLQTEGVDYFDTYAPVVQWSTVRMLLTLILSNGWTTKQVDYTNAFAQAEIQEEVYIEPPKGFENRDKLDKVLHLLKSLYGLKQAPKTFFEKLRAGLLERGFQQSDHDPYLFMKNMIFVVYVDDTIITGPDSVAIDKEIAGLGVSKDEQCHKFELRDEGEVGDFLGIRIEKAGPKKFHLTQTGLINKVLKEADMENCNTVNTPALTTPLGIDKLGEPFKEDWDYASIVGMLMYLANNSRPDIAYAVHQCARFTHCQRNSHSVAIKRILRYLQGTKTKGMFIEPSQKLQVDCYVDADFAGLWGVEDDQNPICVKSRTGYLIMFMGCPLQWVSKLQTQIALSTMEAEYIALSQSMRDLIGIREIIREMKNYVFLGNMKNPVIRAHSKTFVEIPQSNVYEDNSACLKFATMPKMSSRTKHIAIPYHFFRSKVESLQVKVIAINTENQLGDQFTKGLPEPKFVKDRYRLMGW